jgi:LuxR family maltose regulon positive regulatory protein
MALLEHDLASALEWGRRLAEDAVALPFFLSHVPPRLLIAQGEKAKASERLRTMSEETARGITHHHIVFLRLYQALAADTTESALRFLADVLAMTEPEGYIRTFVDEGRLLAPLLRQAIARGISRDYSARLLSIIEAEERRKQTPKAGGTLLSKRELEVLGLLVSEISNQQIAERLYISTGTVKIHVHNILEKLGAKDRSQAVARAKQINLI